MKKHLLCAVLLASSTAFAQSFTPTRPTELVVHTGPGGGSDVLARAMANMMEKEKLLPVRAQVVNKPGGGGWWPRRISPRRRARRTPSASSPGCGSPTRSPATRPRYR